MADFYDFYVFYLVSGSVFFLPFITDYRFLKEYEDCLRDFWLRPDVATWPLLFVSPEVGACSVPRL